MRLKKNIKIKKNKLVRIIKGKSFLWKDKEDLMVKFKSKLLDDEQYAFREYKENLGL